MMVRQLNRAQVFCHFIEPLETRGSRLLGFQKRQVVHTRLILNQGDDFKLPTPYKRNEGQRGKFSFYQIRDAIFGKPQDLRRTWKESPFKAAPGLWQALLEFKQLPMQQRLWKFGRVIDSRLRTSDENAHLLWPQLWSGLRSYFNSGKTLDEERQVLRFYNALILRLMHFDLSPQNFSLLIKDGISYSLQAQSTSTLRYYANLGKHATLEWTKKESLDAFAALRRWIYSDYFQGRRGPRRKKELSLLLTECGIPSVNGKDVKLDFSSRTVFSPFYQSLLRKDFFSLLGELGDFDGVLQVWASFQNGTIPLDDSNQLGAKPDLTAVACEVVETLASLGRADAAWRVINEHRAVLTRMSKGILSYLLDYPKHIIQWDPALRRPVLQKYEELLQEAEKSLGIRWTGQKGEWRYHVTTGEIWSE